MVSVGRTVRFTFASGFIVAALLAGACIGGCGGGGDSSSSGTVAGTPPAPPPPLPPAVTTAITKFADDPANLGVQVIVTSPNSLTAGTFIVISGTTNYNGTFAVVSATATTFTITAVFVANDATGGWQTGGGLIAGCATSGATGAITLSTVPSRFTGVAPLAIFFDATGSTATATARPFHDLEYRWNFGDSGSGTWSNGSRPGSSSRNSATGPVGAHMFETPGTYIVSLNITDGANTVTNACVQIAVLDPEVVFAGARTTCFSTSGDFSSCPAGANTVTSSDFLTVTGAPTSGNTVRRLLLRRGETWTVGSLAQINVNGPGAIGAYGAGARPVIQATGSINMLRFSNNSTPGIADWRVMDLQFDGNGNPNPIAVDMNGGINQVSLLRLNIVNTYIGMRFDFAILDFHNTHGSPGHTLYDEIAIVDNTTSLRNVIAGSGYSIYAAASRLMILGNDLSNNLGGEHVTRLPYVDRGVVSNNTFSHPAPTKHSFTLRAQLHGMGGVTGNNGNDTKFVVVSDNKFNGEDNAFQTVMYGPQATADERVTEVVTERNWFTAAGAATGTQMGMILFAREQTIRNNLVDTTGGKAHTGIRIDDGLLVGSDNVRVYNNTILSNDASGDFAGVIVRTAVTNVTVKNNLAYAPLDTQHLMVSDLSGVAIASNNSSNAQVLSTSPNLTVFPPVSPADWKPMVGSYAIGAGASVPVWSDFFLTSQPPARDLGAVLH